MLGSLTAILLAGFLNWVGKRRPHLTGEGRLQPGVGEELVAGEEKAAASTVDASAIAAAGVTAIALYLLGTACFKLFGLPGPVAMLFLAVAVKVYLVTAEGTARSGQEDQHERGAFLPESLLPRHVHRGDVRSEMSADRARRPLPLTAGG